MTTGSPNITAGVACLFCMDMNGMAPQKKMPTEQQKAVCVWLCDYAEHRQPYDWNQLLL